MASQEDRKAGGLLGRRVSAGLAALFVASVGLTGIAMRGPSFAGSAFMADLTKDDQHGCPLWPQFCTQRQECVDRYHNGDATMPVSPELAASYEADCVLYCLECECPGADFCELMGESAAESTDSMTYHVDTWVMHGTTNATASRAATTGVCEWDGAAVYSQSNEVYPACPGGHKLFGMPQGGFCCKNDGGEDGAAVDGGCADGDEEDDEFNASICAVFNNPYPNGYDYCTYEAVDMGNACSTVYGLGTWQGVDFTSFFSYSGDVDNGAMAGPFIHMAEPDNEHSPRYWLRFGSNFGLYKYTGTGLVALTSAPPPVALWTFDEDMSDSIGTMDMALAIDGGGSYVDTVAGCLVLDGFSVARSDGMEGRQTINTAESTATSTVYDNSDYDSATADDAKGPVQLTQKTLTAWVSLDTLDQPEGGYAAVISVNKRTAAPYDAIVFEGRQDDTWMAGSESDLRTQDFDVTGSRPQEDSAAVIRFLAIVYGGDGNANQIEMFVDGVSKGAYEKDTQVTYETDDWGVTLGSYKESLSFSSGANLGTYNCWRGTGVARNGCLQGKIYEAAIYDVALTAAQIASLAAGDDQPSFEPDQTYEVRLKSEIGAGGWTSTGVGGLCHYAAGEWEKLSDGTTQVLIQDKCALTQAGSDPGTMLGHTITMFGKTGTLDDTTITWDDGDVWQLRSGASQRIRAWVDGALVADVYDASIASGAVGFATYHASMQAFGVKMLDANAQQIYGKLEGGITAGGVLGVYVDGVAYATDVAADTVQHVQLDKAFTMLAVSVQNPFTVDPNSDTQVTHQVHTANSGDGTPTFFWAGPKNFGADGATRNTYPSTEGVTRLPGDFTAMGWVKPTARETGWFRWLGKGTSCKTINLWLSPEGGSGPGGCFLSQIKGVSNIQVWPGHGCTDDQRAPLDEWTHLSQRLRSSDSSHCAFMNGLPYHTCNTGMADHTPCTDDSVLTIGGSEVGLAVGPAWVKGVALFDVPLTDAEIAVWGGADQVAYSLDLIIGTEGMNYDDAEEYCLGRSRRLATLYGPEDEDLVSHLIGDGANSVWLGMNDREVEGSWEWLDNTRGHSVYTNWRPGQPDSGGASNQDQDCLRGARCWNCPNEFDWSDGSCALHARPVCGPAFTPATEEPSFAAAISSSAPQTLDGDGSPDASDIRTEPGAAGWKCSVAAANDADGTQWFEPGYEGKAGAQWVRPQFVPHSEGFAPANAAFVGIESTTSNVTSPVVGTGALYCIYDAPGAVVAEDGEHVTGGNFESPPTTSWKTAYSYSAPNSLPGWTIVSGNVDWGAFNGVLDSDGGTCSGDCAADGEQFLDLCGSSAGAIEQVITTTEADKTYILSYSIVGSPASSTNSDMKAFINGNGIMYASQSPCGGGFPSLQWCWGGWSHEFQATGPTTIKFESVSDGGSCMLLDNVSVKEKTV